MAYDQISDADLNLTGFMDAPIGLMVLSNRVIQRINTEIERIFGWTRDELEGRSIRALYPSSVDYEKTGSRWRRWLDERPRYTDERFMQCRSGEIIWTRASGRTLTPGDPFRLMVWTFEHLENRPPNSATLTPREREVARYIVNGYTSKETGLAMGISPRTVEVHRSSVMKKLGVQNAAELVAKMIVQN
ncbi:LuxR family transcriptional regulator [Rhodovulum sulfidophilum]|uniref:LuxR family transcriptional regulator n=1 Tax=Rhodovulum sulfidophilum TaxID=35806 RepID=UPI0009526A2F|nr:LuxR C-terminal-related transcriptional regulator [Rhodovulum sulfidophilum]MBL3575851.1 PAS domain S-box protein [Rhodovulum sulfidophilum]MCE8432761.1 LuxR C-terminal-related transcriptional regulator [Rhodovulum sulfidophilum]MCF4119122.1 LuxR C-terminal-related transcriptional regulator [Rhodovulum sulfidophilum]OLS52712.1 LuxR family transcriptional regulator [Rhodovulum sulfidophilum]